jgi:hypothetical protein
MSTKFKIGDCFKLKDFENRFLIVDYNIKNKQFYFKKVTDSDSASLMSVSEHFLEKYAILDLEYQVIKEFEKDLKDLLESED